MYSKDTQRHCVRHLLADVHAAYPCRQEVRMGPTGPGTRLAHCIVDTLNHTHRRSFHVQYRHAQRSYRAHHRRRHRHRPGDRDRLRQAGCRSDAGGPQRRACAASRRVAAPARWAGRGSEEGQTPGCPTVSINCNFIRAVAPSKVETLHARAELVRRGRRMYFVNITALTGDDIVAMAQGVYAVPSSALRRHPSTGATPCPARSCIRCSGSSVRGAIQSSKKKDCSTQKCDWTHIVPHDKVTPLAGAPRRIT